MFCVNGQWGKTLPTCIPAKNMCRKRPWSSIPNGFLLTLKRMELKNEYNYRDPPEEFPVFLSANYACYAGFKFQQYRNIELKSVSNQVLVTQSVSCVDEDRWEFSPNCVRA